jgi:hypothetical protein
MTTKDTLALALEALEGAESLLSSMGMTEISLYQEIDTAITDIKQVKEPVGINGLTEAETSATMSVMGLSKPAPKQAEPEQ